jgi:serine/threonine-protein kinase
MRTAIEASALPSKVCAACGGRYPADALFCPTDGTPLQSAAAARASDDPYLGQEIAGHIEICQLVGVGAMGRVYRAFQRGIDRDVAVKILHRELSANPQLVARFTREAKVASRLQHPNVVQVLLTGQLPDGALYIVMEYLDGLSLQSALAAAGGALPLPRALHIVLQLCEAVGEAHAQGIVHRDLKPENVMLVRRGSDPDFVKVLDFGIARINWGEQSVATAAGLIFGTARYISPEGAQGNPVVPASDVYSIATLLYQVLSGRTPFDGDQAVGLLVQQIHDPAPPLRSIPRAAYVPEPIADVVMRSLSKDPAAREPDARAFGQAIFDAAKLAGLSPDELSRPLLNRAPAPMKLPPVERTKQLDLTPDVVARMTPSAPAANANGHGASSEPGQRPLAAATVKWEPPSEFQARLAEGTRADANEQRVSGGAARGSEPDRSAPNVPVAEGSRPRLTSNVDATLDDLSLDPGRRPSSRPTFPTPTPSEREVRRTVPGDPDGPVRTHYKPPAPEVTGMASPVHVVRLPSSPEHVVAKASRPPPQAREEPSRRPWLVVVLCFVLGAAIAAGWAYKTGKLGPSSDAEQDRFVARATDAMFKNQFDEPPGENVRDITDEGLRRWPHERRLIDIRVRAANELTSQALAQRAAGDVLEALKLAKLAHELDPHDASAKRLVEQYEAELASFSAPAAPTLSPPQERPPAPTRTRTSAPAPAPAPQRADYKVLLEVSNASPRIGQTVDLVARVAPPKGDFDAPGFAIAGPGVPGGVRMPAQEAGPGVFKASYAFLDAGKFDVTFTVQVKGEPITAKRSIHAFAAPEPVPAPTPPPAPTPTGSVKWM